MRRSGLNEADDQKPGVASRLWEIRILAIAQPRIAISHNNQYPLLEISIWPFERSLYDHLRRLISLCIVPWLVRGSAKVPFPDKMVDGVWCSRMYIYKGNKVEKYLADDEDWTRAFVVTWTTRSSCGMFGFLWACGCSREWHDRAAWLKTLFCADKQVLYTYLDYLHLLVVVLMKQKGM